MATPGELVKTMAEALGISEGTVFQFDRSLSEGGLRSKSGRGRSAARVTAEDAANLLIAIAAAPISGPAVKDAVQTCRIYGSLPAMSTRAMRKAFGDNGLPCLAKLPVKHSLHTAL